MVAGVVFDAEHPGEVFVRIHAGEREAIALSGHGERVEVDLTVSGACESGVATAGGAVVVGAGERIDKVIVSSVGEG